MFIVSNLDRLVQLGIELNESDLQVINSVIHEGNGATNANEHPLTPDTLDKLLAHYRTPQNILKRYKPGSPLQNTLILLADFSSEQQLRQFLTLS